MEIKQNTQQLIPKKNKKEMNQEQLKKENKKLLILSYFLAVILGLSIGINIEFIADSKRDDNLTITKLKTLKSMVYDNYYKEDNLEKVLKDTLGKDYMGTEQDFANYILKRTVDDLETYEEEKWKGYTFFYPKVRMDSFNNSIKTGSKTAEYKEINTNTYYMKFGSFYNEITTQLFEDHINDMKKHECLIIDLRNNHGGNKDAATQLADYFLEKGTTIIKEQARDKNMTIKAEKDIVLHPKKIIILVNKETASSSELFTVALRDNLSNVKIIGEKTFGKGIEMNTIQFDDGTGLSVVSRYFQGIHTIIHNKGIIPDIIIKDEKEQMDRALEMNN